MKKIYFFIALLAGCTSIPEGPGVLVLPGTGKSFDQFRYDDHECRQYAQAQVGGKTPDQAGTDSGVKSAAIGTVVGAAAGAALGGSSGAATGAGVGLAGGALVGSGAAQSSSLTLQQRYDFGYQQCMYAKGHRIPMAERSVPRASRYAPARQATTPPPPPPQAGTPVPPPGSGVPPDYKPN
jgi:YmgG-like glycine-zipper protein